ncbi:hypothetical protein [Neobacillus niacini]|uniref:hypothetical protein n=1 Tax=Neobacillus niacini TaxID=86668 RepID=UPI00203AD74A|nr:hypothetical protein [Neobacillus niacini]MCM3692201.1 hypothetical protein [Neobacillus niacini]
MRLKTNSLKKDRKEEIKQKCLDLAESTNPNKFLDFNSYLNDLLGIGGLKLVDKDGIDWTSNFNLSNPEAKYACQIFFGRIAELRKVTKDSRGDYVQMFQDFYINLVGKLKNAERSYLLKLMLRINYDKVLMWNDKPMVKKDIADYLGISEDMAKKLLQRYVTLEIIIKKKSGKKWHYKFNKKSVLMGKIDGKNDFVKVFLEKLEETIIKVEKIEQKKQTGKGYKKGKERRTSAVGILHSIIPYFHFQTYYLTKYPNRNIMNSGETVLDALKRDRNSKRRKHVHLPMTQLQQIMASRTTKENDEEDQSKECNLAKMEKDLVFEHLDTLQEAGALMYYKSSGITTVRIHPHLLFSAQGDGKDNYTEYVLSDFNENKSASNEKQE